MFSQGRCTAKMNISSEKHSRRWSWWKGMHESRRHRPDEICARR